MKDARAIGPVSWTADARTTRGPKTVVWPEATVADVALQTAVSGSQAAQTATGTGPVRAAGTPISLGQATDDVLSASKLAQPGVAKARVTVFDRATTARSGVNGLLFGLQRTDAGAGAGKVTVRVDYSQFANAFGGDWASRLRLVVLPSCALSTPDIAQCQTAKTLPTANDSKSSTLTADTTLSSGRQSVLAVQAGPSGDNGDYKATELSQAGTWNVGTQTGDFTWSYPLRMPPSLGGPSPSVAINYSSSSIDGRTATSNNQGGWIGDGFDAWPGYIERKYASCVDDNPSHPTGDQCWFSNNATLSFSGHAGELIETTTPNVWKLKNDDGTKIERLTDSARANGDNDNEYWKVTTTDGTQYFFGYHRLPNWATGNAVTDSVWTVPVYGNNPGEPCYDSTFANAWCPSTAGQAWRWNLDYVIDPHDNTLAYFYGKETGWYGRDNTPSQRTAYIRGGYLDRAEYGTRKGTEYADAAPQRVVFNTAERCLAECWTGTPWASAPVPSAWDDTPWDQDCAASPCTDKTSPTFWSARRLTKVTAQLRSGPTTYRDIESWTLRHEFLDAGDNEGSPMWLRGVTRTGHVTTAGGIAVSEPEIVFSPGAEPLPNRIDRQDGRTLLTRFRIKSITTEAGGQINVDYSSPDCTKDTLPTVHANTTRCMPVYYAPSGTPTLDWFNKYVVTKVTLHDVKYTGAGGNEVASNPDQTIFYDYLDGAAWHYTTDEITQDKFKTWGDWRGYGRVQVRAGAQDGQQTMNEFRYLRGMDGDKQPSGVRDIWVSPSWGGPAIEDHEALNGFTLEQTAFNGPNGSEVNSTVNEPWRHGPTATRTRNGNTTEAWVTKTGTVSTRLTLGSGGFRTAKTTTTFNDNGLPITVDALGDLDVDGDETCTRNSYARNDSIWMIDKVSQVEKLSVACSAATTPAAPSTVLNRTRTFYDSYSDEGSFGAAPTKGDVVRTEELDSWVQSSPQYVRTATTTYDANGRKLDVYDPLNYKTATAYNVDTATGLVASTTVTNPLNHIVTTQLEAAWDEPVKITDVNGVTTELSYNGLGRLAAVWLPGRAKAQTPSLRFDYLVRSTAGPSAVTTETLLPTGTAYKKSITLFDGFLRQRQVQTQAPGGGRTVAETLHNAQGRVAWTSLDYFDNTGTAPNTTLAYPTGTIPAVTRLEYDDAGRQIASAFVAAGVEKWRATTSYGGDRIHTIPAPGGTATTKLVDVRDQTLALLQYKSFADVGSSDPTRFHKTSYAYTLTGKLKTVIDPAGNVWSYAFDLRGRQKSSTDPDKGTTTSSYDASGQLVTTTSPLGSGTATTAFTYDPLGRRTSIRDDSITGPIRVDWVYDETFIAPANANKAKGKLTSSTRYVAGNPYVSKVDAYDVYGRITAASVILPSSETELCAAAAPNACTYKTTTTYRPNGTVKDTTMPAAADLAAEKLNYGYNDVGSPSSLLSPIQLYAGSVKYNKLSQITERILGASGKQVKQTFDYDEPTRRLIHTNAVPELQPEAAAYYYQYDDLGNIKKISDTPQGQTADYQCFDYDHLRSLTGAWTPLTGDCLAAKSVAALGGPASYWHSWTFDDIGNRKTEVRHATTDTNLTYSYPASGAGSVRPHTVTNVSATGGQSWSRTYGYDNTGNTTTRPGVGAGTQQIVWDREGKMTSVTEGSNVTAFIYDADGNRLIRKEPDGSKTLYLGSTEVRYNKTPDTKVATRYYTHAGNTIAMRNAAGVCWLINDHHGTAELTIDATTLAVAKRRTTPYGEQRGSTAGAWKAGMDKGFVGGTQDATGLTHLGARQYDPAIGRFISRDPVVDSDDPQQRNGYSYGSNNPTTMSDASGLKAIEDNGGDWGFAPVTTTPPPIYWSPRPIIWRPPVQVGPPTPSPVVRTVGLFGVVTLLLMLGGDSAPQYEAIGIDTEQRDEGCFGNNPNPVPIYYPLDDQGRAQGVEACLGPWSSEWDNRPPPTPVVGWRNDGTMNRGHLLARRFGGLSIPENIVPMYEWTNKSQMATVENRIAGYLASGERVYFQATPVYATPHHPQYRELAGAPAYISVNIWTRTDHYNFAIVNQP